MGKDFGALIGIVVPKNTPQPVVDFYVDLSKEFVIAYKSKFKEVYLNQSESFFGPKEFLKELILLESLI